MLKKYYQMNREELEKQLEELIEHKEIDPDTGTVLFIDDDGAAILDRLEEPEYSVMRVNYASLEELIGVAKEFDPFVEIVHRPWLVYEVKSALNKYLRKQQTTCHDNDFMTCLTGNA